MLFTGESPNLQSPFPFSAYLFVLMIYDTSMQLPTSLPLSLFQMFC